ncbi:MAG: hypothetical protein JWM37_464 [Candidatus Saccharibacteria bacterium]|nr:hypothetical protein [Candidatus Saccharibacteria bacterium]
MNSKKLFFGLTSLLIILVVGILFGARQAVVLLQSRSQELASLKANSQATTAKQAQLTKDKKDLRDYADLNIIAQTVVPQDKDQAQAVREIVDLARQNGIGKLSSITFAASTLGGQTPSTQRGLTQVTPVKGMTGVFTLPITVTQAPTDAVPYGNFMAFLSALEKNRRTAQVASITIQPNAKNLNQVAFTLVINEYVKP